MSVFVMVFCYFFGSVNYNLWWFWVFVFISQRQVQPRSLSCVTLKMVPFHKRSCRQLCSPAGPLSVSGIMWILSALQKHWFSWNLPVPVSSSRQRLFVWYASCPVSIVSNFSTFFRGRIVSKQWCAWNTLHLHSCSAFSVSDRSVHMEVAVG